MQSAIGRPSLASLKVPALRRATRRAVGALVGWLLLSSAAAQGDAVSIEIDVLPTARRYVELAAHPPYLAVALKNNGFSPSDSGLLIIKDKRTLRFKNAELAFVRRDQDVFHYRATVEWSIGPAQSKFEIPIHADVSRIGDGKVTVRAYPPLARFFPDELKNKLRLKVQSLAAPAVQKRMLEYLDALPGSNPGNLEIPRMSERIMFDAYNLAAVAPGLAGGREPGDAEPLADQMMLLATLVIWLIAVPGFLAVRAWRRRKRREHPVEGR